MKFIKVFLSLTFMAAALPAAALDGEALLKRIDANLMPPSYESYRKLVNIEPDGKKKEFIFYSVKKGRDSMAMLYLAPASEKGRSTLRLGDNMWLYIPNVGRPMRITSLQSVTGGVFNNADIMQVDYAAEYSVKAASKTAGGYLLDLKARTKAVAYDSLKMWAKADETLEKIECYSASGMLIKTLEFKEPKDFGGGFTRPSVMETYSPLYKGYKSLMIYSQVKAREFKDEVFTTGYMSKLENLRK
ncbi:MAG: outer membrane lipoprotein-sorting protein [Elusimicrobia bacterium HGW-Elusimicrobia-3]|nr:MAG: outer membrane lipoprotein-sorting protein [Elusimicrobia bacterium HGW-Elusimicrobia-3]